MKEFNNPENIANNIINENYLSYLNYEFQLTKQGKIPYPSGCDTVGYEFLVSFILKHNIQLIEGDFVEIGTLFGAGLYKLSKMLEAYKLGKKIFVIDCFNVQFDKSLSYQGYDMSSIYIRMLSAFGGLTQLDVFKEITKSCNNIELLIEDSKKVDLPCQKVSFAFIDGNHNPDYVENDFYLIWEKLSNGGCITFHDFGGVLPQTTNAIEKLVKKHIKEFSLVHFYPPKFLLFLIKK